MSIARTGASPLVLPRSRTHAALPEASSGGDVYVRIPLHVKEVDALIRIGRLKEDSRTDAEVLQAAVLSLLYRALGETEIGREMLRYV